MRHESFLFRFCVQSKTETKKSFLKETTRSTFALGKRTGHNHVSRTTDPPRGSEFTLREGRWESDSPALRQKQGGAHTPPAEGATQDSLRPRPLANPLSSGS